MKQAVLIVALLFSFQLDAQSMDYRLLRQFHVERNVKLDPAFSFVTDAGPVVSLAFPFGYALGALSQKYDVGYQNSVFLLASMGSTLGLTSLLKYSIKRERPYETYSEFNSGYTAHSPSFPSGHSSSIFAFATSTMLLTRGMKYHVPVSITSFAFAGTVAYSRMHLGVHYPSDVLVGALIGIGSTILTQWATNKIFQ